VISCADVRARLETLVDGESDGGDARAHLATCPACRTHHAEAASLPWRLAALRSPEPPPSLVQQVLRRVGRNRVGPLRFWSLLGAEALLALVTLWYLSGLDGLARIAQGTASEVAAIAGGGSEAPPAPAVDLFLLLVSGLMLAVTLYHLALLSRQDPRPGQL
jgi:anti-sigma factor RsiW